MAVCRACEQRRKIAVIMKDAFMAWTKDPMGPALKEIVARLKAEAVANGELDDRA